MVKTMKLKDWFIKYGDIEIPEDLRQKLMELVRSQDVWNLKHHDDYWWINGEGFIDVDSWSHWPGDISRLEIGNVFLTEEEAEADLERRKVEALLLKHGGRREFKVNAENWILWAHHYTDCPERELEIIMNNNFLSLGGVIHFDSEADIKNALKVIGKERIINALFRKCE